MHDPMCVCVGEPLSHAACELQSFAQREPLLARVQAIGEALPAQKLHGDENHAVCFVDLVDDGDVRVLERRGCSSLLHEALAALTLLDQFRR